MEVQVESDESKIMSLNASSRLCNLNQRYTAEPLKHWAAFVCVSSFLIEKGTFGRVNLLGQIL